MATKKKEDVPVVDKLQAFKDALKKVSSEIKNENVYVFGDKEIEKVPTVSTGSLALDNILGGGVARGRVIEFYGPEASGKTSIAMTVLSNFQKLGGTGVLIDCEQAADLNYFKKLGVDVEKLGYSQAIIAEDVLNMVRQLCNSGAVDIIVIDSIPSMIPRAELADDALDKASVATTARLMSKGLRYIIKAASDNNCTVIFLNQIRSNVGVMYGPQTSQPGGNALKFFATQRVEIKRKDKIEEGGEIIGNKIAMKCIKNKIAPPFGECSSVLTFNRGINQNAEIMDLGLDLEVIYKEGAGTTYFCNIDEGIDISGFGATRVEDDPTKVKIAIGKAKVVQEIEANENLAKELSKQLVQKLNEKNHG